MTRLIPSTMFHNVCEVANVLENFITNVVVTIISSE